MMAKWQTVPISELYDGLYLTPQTLEAQESNFSLYSLGNGVFMLILPKDFAVEDLFAEFEDEVEECVKALYDDNYLLRDVAPMNLTRAASAARRKGKVQNLDEAKGVIRNEQDVKDRFWLKLAANNYRVADCHAKAMQALIEKAQ